jgi:effector-binding domain-containing protein
MPPVESEIVITGPEPQVVMGHHGPFEELNQATEAFMGELEAQGVHPIGPCTRIFHTEPGPEPFAELCVPIEGEREVAEPLTLRIFPECAFARAHYQGPVQGVRMAHEMMVHQMAERGWRPAGPLMQTIHERGDGHVSCTLKFVVAKMEGGPEPGPEGGEPHEGGPTPVILGPVKVIKPTKPVIE